MKLKFPDSGIPRFFFLEHLENCQNWLPEGTVLAIKTHQGVDIVKLKHGSTTLSYNYQENHCQNKFQHVEVSTIRTW